jgi:hypothetical protein
MEGVALVGLLGAGAGLVGAFAGIAAFVWGLGYREYLGGKKRATFSPISKEELKEKLIALNSSELPYEIKRDSETDLMVEWKIVDAKWFAVFARERLQKTYRAFIILDERRRTARYYEEMGTVQWLVGTQGLLSPPKIGYQNQFFKGRILFQKSWGVQYGIKDDGTLGKVYQYKFDIGYVRDPVKRAVEESGWEFVPVVRKEHATYRSLTTRPI